MLVCLLLSVTISEMDRIHTTKMYGYIRIHGFLLMRTSSYIREAHVMVHLSIAIWYVMP